MLAGLIFGQVMNFESAPSWTATSPSRITQADYNCLGVQTYRLSATVCFDPSFSGHKCPSSEAR